MIRPEIEPLTTKRLLLEPLTVDHAAQMVGVLTDASLYEFTGGQAPSLEALQQRYAAQIVGHSDDNTQGWLNWIVRPLGGPPSGFIQATLAQSGAGLSCELAWVISPAYQGQGIASEGAGAVMHWLQSVGVSSFVANIHPDHLASGSVARKLGLGPTQIMNDGELRWVSL